MDQRCIDAPPEHLPGNGRTLFTASDEHRKQMIVVPRAGTFVREDNVLDPREQRQQMKAVCPQAFQASDKSQALAQTHCGLPWLNLFQVQDRLQKAMSLCPAAHRDAKCPIESGTEREGLSHL